MTEPKSSLTDLRKKHTHTHTLRKHFDITRMSHTQGYTHTRTHPHTHSASCPGIGWVTATDGSANSIALWIKQTRSAERPLFGQTLHSAQGLIH